MAAVANEDAGRSGLTEFAKFDLHASLRKLLDHLRFGDGKTNAPVRPCKSLGTSLKIEANGRVAESLAKASSSTPDSGWKLATGAGAGFSGRDITGSGAAKTSVSCRLEG